MLFTRNLAGKLSDRLGPRPVVLAGFLLALAGSVVYTHLGIHTNEAVLVLSLVVRGTGLGAVTIPVMSAVYLGLRADQVPNASSATRIAQQVGGSFGTAILGMILVTQLVTHHAGGLAGQASAFGTAFWWSLGLTAIAIIPALAPPGKGQDERGRWLEPILQTALDGLRPRATWSPRRTTGVAKRSLPLCRQGSRRAVTSASDARRR